jgi:hypothetical protein
MDGLEAVEMKLSEVKNSTQTLRYDSDYYLKDYVRIEGIIKSQASNFLKFDNLDLNGMPSS